MVPENSYTDAVYDMKTTLEYFFDHRPQQASVVCPVTLRECADYLTNNPDKAQALPTIVHPAQLDDSYLRTGIVMVGSSAGANLVINSQLRLKANRDDINVCYSELFYPYVGVTEQEFRQHGNDWILHEHLIGFAAKFVFF